MPRPTFDAPLVLAYLRDLKKNNHREWFEANRPRFDAAREEFKRFVQTVIDALGEVEPAWGRHDAADCLFRIYRDVRFAKDKTPYKVSFSASIGDHGKSVHDPGVYVAIEPDGQSMLAGGMYQPTPTELVHIRARIAQDPAAFRALASDKTFRKYFPEGINGDRSKTVRGYRPDHEAFDFIRIKSHCAFRHLPDPEIEAKSYPALAAKSLAALVPLCRWLKSARVSQG